MTKYNPQVNDYVKWKKGVEGWVYFADDDYITIEYYVRPKDKENYHACPIHANERLLVVCYKEDWNQLKYIKSRTTKYEEEENPVEMVVSGTGGKGK